MWSVMHNVVHDYDKIGKHNKKRIGIVIIVKYQIEFIIRTKAIDRPAIM